MKKLVFYSFLSTFSFTYATTIVNNDLDYFKIDDNTINTEIIFADISKKDAIQSLQKESIIHQKYQKLYGWKLDEKLYVGLISSHNEVPNGFSSQFPNNRQINYIGGTQLLDEFSSISWLDTLLYHESAHNYQTNIKTASFSQFLHSYLGNGSFLFDLPFITPNITESSFLLEGNAVLHESLFGNGGRIYNGLYKAETILQAQANNLTPAKLYNERIAFPYGDISYILGGFFQLYLAQKYGIEKVDSYFKYHAKDWWFSQYTNSSMQDAIGITFEEAVRNFAKKYTLLSQNFVMLNGIKIGVTSKLLYPMNSDSTQIYFMINKDATSKPQLIVIDKKQYNIKKYEAKYKAGKVIKFNHNYYTQGYAYNSATQITQGLYDADANLVKSTASKMIQGYLSDGTAVYFDIKSSFDQPQLYVGNNFYAQVNSTVFIDNQDNLYYFKQEKYKRTLYKNNTPLYSYNGYYGIVSDVDSNGAVYFVANSSLGSTLFRYKDKTVQRVSNADNIAYAKLINDKSLLFCALGQENYYYTIDSIHLSNQKPFFQDFFPQQNRSVQLLKQKNYKVKNYNALQDMHYSGTNLQAYMSENGFAGTLQLNFADPLEQNSLSIYLQRDDDTTLRIGGIYINSVKSFNYTLSLYNVLYQDKATHSRNFGISADIQKYLYLRSRDSVSIELSYVEDYYKQQREPLLFSLDFTSKEKYAYSFYNNYLNSLSLLAQQERKDNALGALYSFEQTLYHESYIGLYGGTLFMLHNLNQTNAQVDARGIKLTQYQDMDRASFYLPNLLQDYYVNNISYAKISFKKVFNLSSYWFTFPLSLQRESLYVDYTYYRLNAFQEQQKKESINLYTVGTTLATLFFNKLELPISIEYNHIENDSDIFEQKDSVMMKLEAEF